MEKRGISLEHVVSAIEQGRLVDVGPRRSEVLHLTGANRRVRGQHDARRLDAVVDGQGGLAALFQGGDELLVLELEALLICALLGPRLVAVEERGLSAGGRRAERSCRRRRAA